MLKVALFRDQSNEVVGHDMQCNTSDLPSPMLSTAFNEFEYSAESPLANKLQFSPLRKLKPLNPPGPPMRVELGLSGRKSPLY